MDIREREALRKLVKHPSPTYQLHIVDYPQYLGERFRDINDVSEDEVPSRNIVLSGPEPYYGGIKVDTGMIENDHEVKRQFTHHPDMMED